MVLVSIAPYKDFVERIAGDKVHVLVVVPEGRSPHTYEPTARQVLATAEADLWFTIGESFEGKVAAALRSHRSDLELIDLREGIELITDEGHCHCVSDRSCSCADLHVWLSPPLVKEQAMTIAQALLRRYPEFEDYFLLRLEGFHSDLDRLHEDLLHMLQPLEQRKLVISHPAYRYFCREYGLEQIPVEQDGKPPSPRRLDELLKELRELSVSRFFAVRQHSDRAIRLLAKQMNAKIVILDPLAEDYFNNMRETGKRISGE